MSESNQVTTQSKGIVGFDLDETLVPKAMSPNIAEHRQIMKDTISQLKANDYKVVIITDGTGYSKTQQMLSGVPASEFDNIITGANKENPEAWGKIVDELGVPAEELTVVDDKPKIIENVFAEGAKGMLFTNAVDLQQQMRKAKLIK